MIAVLAVLSDKKRRACPSIAWTFVTRSVLVLIATRPSSAGG
jgi:hypothetical protein